MTTMTENMHRTREAFKAALTHTREYAKKLHDLISRKRPEDRQGRVEIMKTGFEQAIGSLRESILGQQAVSGLPWYLLIGPADCGKSTVLKNSGLQAATYPREEKEHSASGRTHGCDWWVTNEGVFLDTAGRYAAEDEGRDEWLALLDTIKEQRRQVPLNGVLVMVSLPDLFVAKDKEIELHAKKIRARLDELIQRLGVVFPVYLVLTKCDLLRGFVEFFENLNNVAREEQAWGRTFPVEAPAGSTPLNQFEAGFERLLQALHMRCHARLLSLLGSRKIQEVFSFPLQLSAAKQNLTHFVDQLFPPALNQDRPLLRGFYLTSGTQKGQPLDQVVNAVNRRAGLPEFVGAPCGEPKEQGPYFIKQLFTGIIIPDKRLARPSSAAKRRMMLQKRMVTVGAAVAGVACVSAAVYSYSLNGELGEQIRESAEKSYHSIIPEATPFIESVQDRNLDRFRQLVQVLQTDREEGAPLMRRWGMNREATLHEPARDLYIGLFYRLYRDHTRTQLEDTLRSFAADPSRMPANRDSDFYYSYLKTYLMLSVTSDEKEPIHLDQPFLAEWLRQIWHEILPSRYGVKAAAPEVMKAVDQQIDTYSRLLREGQAPFHRDLGLVQAARTALQQLPYPERIYARIQREMMREYKPEPVTLASLLQGAKTSLLESNYEIPGFFTPKFDNGLFNKTRDRILDQAYTDSWVLDVPPDSRADVEKAVHGLYRTDYIREWSEFLASVKLRPVSNREEAITLLLGLTQDTSVLVTLLKAVDSNTSFSALSDFFCDVSKGWIHRDVPSHPVAETFKSLHEFVTSCPEGEGAPLKQYMQQLQQLRDALTRTSHGGEPSAEQRQAEHRLAELITRFDQRAQAAVQLLLQPLRLADVETGLEDCAKAIGELYPFRPGQSDEATIPDLSEFFRPEKGRLLTFYKSTVSGGYRQAKAISDALFPPGSSEPKVPFEMKPLAIGGVGLSEIRLVIEGQELVYLNGAPELFSPFQWTGQSEQRGALLQIVVGVDESRRKTYTKQYEGRWGLFRMLQEGNPVPVSPTEFRLSWTFSIGGKKVVDIQFNLKAEHVKHPFAPEFFSSFRCP
ncbi:MAG: type VI secretion system membrane subunit TssM [Nitrospira sp.]|nr:type VI secretion system membrane subunit TssM [Nitrospira sp.]